MRPNHMIRALHEWTRPMAGPAWVESTDPEVRAIVRAHRPEEMRNWVGFWLNSALIQDIVPKATLGMLLAELATSADAIAIPLAYAWAAWVVEFSAGILRAVSDPGVAVSTEKARRGVVKALMVPLVLIMAVIIERMTFAMIGWDPGGKLVMTVAAGLIWESGTSVQRNVGGLWKSVGFNLPIKLPWTRPDGSGGGGQPNSEELSQRVAAELARQAHEHERVKNQLSHMSDRDRERKPNGEARTG